MDISKMTIIGSGAQADIFLHENRAIKLYKPGSDNSEGVHEAIFQKMAHDKGLPVPAVYEVTEIDGRTAIIMEYFQGLPVGEIMLSSMDRAYELLEMSVDIQMKIHRSDAEGFPSQAIKLSRDISKNCYLNESQHLKLSQLLARLQSDERLCHGDYHVLNLIQTSKDVKVIDWVCSSCGCVAADVCRSYMLYLLYFKDIAEVYLDIYCNKAGISKKEVIEWLPVIAGARLSENLEDGHIGILLNLVEGRL